MSEINVFIIDFPYGTTARETVTLNEDGSYSIFINARMSHEMQLKAYEHALDHIKNNDFYADRSVQEIEAERHGITEEKQPEPKKRKKFRHKHDTYLRKRARQEKELAKMGLQFKTILTEDDYGCPITKTIVVPIDKWE